MPTLQTEHFLPDHARDVAAQGALLYPCSGTDVQEPVRVFAPSVRELMFCDVSARGPQVLPGYKRVGCELSGNPEVRASRRHSQGRSYAYVEPCVWSERLKHQHSGDDIVVRWRRGFGQYALAEFREKSISVFMHRGESQGDGGSNTWFLARERRDHEPLSNLFDKLALRLRSPALVVSDGSNCRIRPLRRFHNTDVSAPEAFAAMRVVVFEHWGLRWSCVGYMGRRYGPTLIWQVER